MDCYKKTRGTKVKGLSEKVVEGFVFMTYQTETTS